MEIGNIETLRKFFQSLILLIAIAMIGKGGFQLFKIYQTYSWSSTEGIIIASSLGQSTTGKALYWPELRYRYSVSGREFEARRFSIADTFSYSTNRPCGILEKHRAGSRVLVFYNPQKPFDAVIERFPFESPIPLVGGVFLFLFGVFILPRQFRQWGKNRMWFPN